MGGKDVNNILLEDLGAEVACIRIAKIYVDSETIFQVEMSNPLYLDCLSVSDEVTSGRFKRYVTDQPFTRC